MKLDASEVAEEVARSRKSRDLCVDTLHRVAAWAVARASSRKDAVKKAKRKLHQIHGAYIDGWDPREADRLLDELADPSSGNPSVQFPGDSPDGALHGVCRQILAGQTSTRERLDALDEVYRAVFDITGVPARVVDLGCGLNPFSLPWMRLPPEAEYVAVDIDARMVRLANRFLDILGRQPSAVCQDLFVDPLPSGADVILLMKALSCLERQAAGSGGDLLDRCDARFVVVTFPARSIGGREKGMRENYDAVMKQALAQRPWPVTRLEVGREILYILDKRLEE